MIQERRRHILENLIYFIIWSILFIAPILTFKYNKEDILWNDIFRAWKVLVPLFVIFLINDLLLLPFLLLRKKLWLYLLAVIVLISIIFTCNPFNDWGYGNRPMNRRFREEMMKEDIKHPDTPQKEFQSQEPQPLSSQSQFEGPRPYQKFPDNGNFPPMNSRKLPQFRPLFFMRPLMNFLLLAFLVVGLNIAIKLMFKVMHDSQKMKELEKQNLQTELEYLKHQINPHFFMNTLNNIHALIDIDTEKAKETVLDLSKMMRYVLYDTSQPKLPLEKEIQFLINYTELMKLRYTDKVDIRLNFPENIPNVQVPPMLFISFLENAFKHGVSYQKNSFIYFSLDVKDGNVECVVENSKSKNVYKEQQGGIGLDNVKKRLQLLFNDNYTLKINDDENKYKILLIIPV